MKVFILRLEPELHDLLEKVARARGQDMADFARFAIKVELARLSYLSPDEKKALGVLAETSAAPKRDRRRS